MRPLVASTFARVAELHRALFVLATTGVAISGSRIASDPGEHHSWLFALGFGLLLFAADVLKSVEESAVALSRTSAQPLGRTRVDRFIASQPGRTIAVIVAGLLAIAIAAVVAVARS